jgi:transcription elongation factor Elf1
MADEGDSTTEVKETDIVFDCPYCGKSLAIDYHGAGLNIQCTDCGSNVVVPIPEGMELSDLDSTPEEQDIRMMNLRKLLAASEQRVEGLEREIEELTGRRKILEKQHADHRARLAGILEKVAAIQKSQADTYRALDAIVDLTKEEA